MDDVLRALKQKKKLKQRYEGREDKDRWEAMLSDIVAAADDRIWSHAAMLLEQMTTALDRDGHALEEARELYDFVAQQWAVLRNQCEAAHIKATDEDRRAVEEAVAKAEAHLDVARLEDALDALGVADGAMERLRRRI